MYGISSTATVRVLCSTSPPIQRKTRVVVVYRGRKALWRMRNVCSTSRRTSTRQLNLHEPTESRQLVAFEQLSLLCCPHRPIGRRLATTPGSRSDARTQSDDVSICSCRLDHHRHVSKDHDLCANGQRPGSNYLPWLTINLDSHAMVVFTLDSIYLLHNLFLQNERDAT